MPKFDFSTLAAKKSEEISIIEAEEIPIKSAFKKTKTAEITKPKRKRTTSGGINVHLEDLLITEEEVWEVIKNAGGQFYNWLTYSKKDGVLRRKGALYMIINTVNVLIAKKLKSIREAGK